MSEPVLPQATRRLTLEFDSTGEPTYATVCSPKSFKVRSLAIVPPRHVIPVIFVPGIMGTNIRGNGKSDGYKNQPAWRPPNGKMSGIGEGMSRSVQDTVARQKQMNPDTTEVDPDGKVSLPSDLYTLNAAEAKRRGWGELHWDSYAHALAELERSLNDRHQNPGTTKATPMAVWELAKSLKKIDGKKEEDVLKIWNPIKGDVTALTDDEFTRLDDYYYPVWACGYNWMQSNEISAQALLKRIDEALTWYEKTKYFIPEGKVIVVTHSMGGMVTRRAAQLSPDKILGVVNSVQPVGGAPVVYRRFRAGTEVGGMLDIPGAVAAAIIGWNAADITCVMANSPGPLELLPTTHYPSGWLKMEHKVGDKRELLFNLPISDPYTEIYSKTAKEVWWGMIDESLIDPAGVAKKDKTTPIEMYLAALKQAKKYHDQVQLYCHPNTYAHFGADAKEISFGSVHWTTSADLPSNIKDGLAGLVSENWTKLGKAQVGTENDGITFKLENKAKPKNDDDPDAGDSTVPINSGLLIKENATHVFKMKGFDHAASYQNDNVIDNVLYCLGKIIQGAIPAKDLPQTKGEECPASTSDSPDSASEPSSASAS